MGNKNPSQPKVAADTASELPFTQRGKKIALDNLEVFKPIWEREPPIFVNELGIKWWKEENLNDYAMRPDSFGTTLNVAAYLIEKPDAYRSFVLLDGETVLVESQQSESIAAHIDVMKFLKRDKEREMTPQAHHPIAINTRVKFTDEWLARSQPEEAKRFRNRVGIVTGYRMGASEPIVFFPKSGRFKEQRLFEVAVRKLEVVPD
jgi:hypothetical protein